MSCVEGDENRLAGIVIDTHLFEGGFLVYFDSNDF